MGRWKTFKAPEELEAAFEEYKHWCNDTPWFRYENSKNGAIPIPIQRPYTLQGFAVYCGLRSQTIYNYGQKEQYADFFDTYARIKDEIDNHQFEGAAVNVFNANLVSKKLGLIDKQDYTSSDGSMSPKVEIKVQDSQTASDINKLK